MSQKRKALYIVCAILVVLSGYLGIRVYHIHYNTEKDSLQQNQIDFITVESMKETEAPYGHYGCPKSEDMKMEVIDGVKPKLAITFDDGPHPVFTEQLLDGLKEREIHATFFVVGKNIPRNEVIIKRMHDEGHLIGNHTYDHVKITGMREEDALEQIKRTSDLIEEITGEPTEFIRAPFGTWNSKLEGDASMFPVSWSVDPKDWTTANVEQIVQRVVKKTEENDIILLHDYYDSSVKAALCIIDILTEQGYEFVTVDEMILE